MTPSDGPKELQSTAEQELLGLAPNSSAMEGANNESKLDESGVSGTSPNQERAHQTSHPIASGASAPDPLGGSHPAVTSDKMEGQEDRTDALTGTAMPESPFAADFAQKTDVEKETASLEGAKPATSSLKQDATGTAQSTIPDQMAQHMGQLAIQDEETDTVSRDERARSPSLPPPPPPPKDDKFLALSKEAAPVSAQSSSPVEYDEKQPFEGDVVAVADDAKDAPKDKGDEDSRSEIQSIMDQFETEAASPELEKIMTPRIEMSQPTFHPPRTSSLDTAQPHMGSPMLHRTQSRDSYMFSSSSVRPGSISGVSISSMQQSQESAASPRPPSTIFQPPPPSPDPEPELPFDFHRFLEQLRHRTADPVARFLRSFLLEFGKKQWMVHEQVKIISDFLEFIAKKMALCEVWRTVSDVEFDNAREGMEKLVMNRLYNQTFSPAIPPLEVASPARGRRARNLAPTSSAPGRKGQHQEDVERDAVIAQKIRIYGWIKEEHLDIAPVNDKGRKFLVLAQQELLKINSYRAPRDKVICVLNCCKVIFGFLKNSKGDQSADSFVPLLIYTVLRANPEHLVSNVQYILRFRNQEKLGGEAGYYISSLMGVVTFVEGLDRTNLTVTDEEFERNVEAAVSAIAEGHKADEYESTTHQKRNAPVEPPLSPTKSSYQPHYSEKGAPSRPELTPRNSTEGERAGPRRGNSTRQKSVGAASSDETDEKDAVAGLLRTIQKPLSTIGRMFSDESQSSSQGPSQHPALTPQPGSTPRLSPGPPTRPLQRKSSEESRQRRSPDRSHRARSAGAPVAADSHADEDAAARQARAEAAEAQRIQAQEHRVVVETLQGMFPDLDREVISDVVRVKEGRVGLAVDACLALNN